jgi:hypothetical protein
MFPFLCKKTSSDICQKLSSLWSDNGKKIWEKIPSILLLKPSEVSASIKNNDLSYCEENISERGQSLSAKSETLVGREKKYFYCTLSLNILYFMSVQMARKCKKLINVRTVSNFTSGKCYKHLGF